MLIRSAFFLILLFAASVHAQSYPSQPIRLIVPWRPGGGEAGGGSPADFGRFIQSEIVRYADIVKASGAKVE